MRLTKLKNFFKIQRHFFCKEKSQQTNNYNFTYEKNVEHFDTNKEPVEKVQQENEDVNEEKLQYENLKKFDHFDYQGLKFENQKRPYEMGYQKEELYGDLDHVYDSKSFKTDQRKIHLGIYLFISGSMIIIFIKYSINFKIIKSCEEFDKERGKKLAIQ